MKIEMKLKQKRLEKGLTQKQLAKEINCASGVIGDIERGSRKPSKNIAIKLADYFDTDIEYWRNDNVINDNSMGQELHDKFSKDVSTIDLSQTKQLILDLIEEKWITTDNLNPDDIFDKKTEELILISLKAEVFKIMCQKKINDILNDVKDIL